jgi:hypothetical protein
MFGITETGILKRQDASIVLEVLHEMNAFVACLETSFHISSRSEIKRAKLRM